MARFQVVGAAGYYYIVDTTTGTEFFKGEGFSKADLEGKAARLNEGYANIESGKTDLPNKVPENQTDNTQSENKSSDDNPNNNTGSTPEPTTTEPSVSTDNAGSTIAGTAGKGTSNLGPDSGMPGRRLKNPLGDFSSYTYKISLYMITPESYQRFALGGKLVPKEFYLVAQSGGINNNLNIDNARAPGIDLDYYIDNLILKTNVATKETGAATNTWEYSFQIIEPFGFTFPTKLIAAAKEVQANSAVKFDKIDNFNALRQHFMLSIRFYGYDRNGKLVESSDYPQADVQVTDKQAVFERNFPIKIHDFKFKLDNKAVVYDIKAAMVPEHEGFGVIRGVLKTSKSVTGKTVGDVLKGSDQTTGAANGIIGLEQLLNNEQDDLAEVGLIGVPDRYKIVFAPNTSVESATLIDKDDFNLQKAPVTPVSSTDNVNDRTSQTPPVIIPARTIQLKEGTPIIKCIDQIITQSSYISDAIAILDKEDINPDKKDDDTKQNEKAELAWFSITPMVTKVLGMDYIRKMYAYEITYVIQKYEIPYLNAPSTKRYTPKYYGPNKRYDYWFTGKNTEIISYDQQYNLLYYNATAASSSAPVSTPGKAPSAPVAGNSGDPTGRVSGWFEQINSIKTFLYSPGDQINGKIKILGDPDYLMTSTSEGLKSLYKRFFNNENFTINPTSGQIFIEINFNQVEDYDMKTGLLNPNDSIVFWPYPENLKSKIKGICYWVWQVTSTFNRGVFTQELSVSLPDFTELAGESKPAEQRNSAENKMIAQDDVTGVDAAVEANRLRDEANKNPIAPTKPPAANKTQPNVDDDKASSNSYTDPMGTTDGQAIMSVQGTEVPRDSFGEGLKKIFSLPKGGSGRGIIQTPTNPQLLGRINK